MWLETTILDNTDTEHLHHCRKISWTALPIVTDDSRYMKAHCHELSDTREKKKIPNSCRKSEGRKTQVKYKESETRRAGIFSTAIVEISLYVYKFMEKLLAHLKFCAQV